MSDFEDRARQWLKALFGDTNDKRLKFLHEYQVQASAFGNLRLLKLSDGRDSCVARPQNLNEKLTRLSR